MMDIEKRKVAALKLFNSWIKSPSCVGYVNEEYIETIRELLQPSPPKQSLSALLKGITPENCHDAAWEGVGVADGEVDKLYKNILGALNKALEKADSVFLREKYAEAIEDLCYVGTVFKAAQQPRQDWRTIQAALIVDSSRSEPLLIYPYKDGDVGSLNTAVRDAMFHGDISTEQESEVAQIVGDLRNDGEVALEDAHLILRSFCIPSPPKETR